MSYKQKNSYSSDSKNSNSSGNDSITLKSVDELKEVAESKIENPFDYKAIYDISPENNKVLIELNFCLDSSMTEKEKINYFYENMYLLNTNDRFYLYNKYAHLLKNSEEQKKYNETNIVHTSKIQNVFKNILSLMKQK